MAKKAMAGERRRRRREWVAVASEAVQTAGEAQLITDQQARQLSRAFRRPRISEQIRAAFVGELEPAQLDSAVHETGKIDFDSIIELLIGFFPKLAKWKKFAELFREIMGLKS
jgi:hypothetical protein